MRTSHFTRFIALAALSLGLAGTASDRAQLQRLLSMAGFRSREALGLLMSGKYVLGLALLCTVLFGVLEPGSRMSLNGIAGGLIALFVGTTLPELWLNVRAGQRGGRLDRSLPDALDLMVICAEAGLTIDAAFNRVARELGAKAAGSAGHEGHAARQVDAVCHLNFLQIPKNRTIVRLCAFACIQSVPSQTVDAPLPVENQTIIKRPTRRS